MLILEDLKAELANYRPQLKELRDVLAVDSATEKISELQMMVEQPGFWDDPSLPLAKNFFKDQAKKLRNLLDFFSEICYNIFVGVLVFIRRGVAKCLLSVIKIME